MVQSLINRFVSMAKRLERKDIAVLVLQVVQGWHFDTQITEDTDFEIDIPIEAQAKSLYYYATFVVPSVCLFAENAGNPFVVKIDPLISGA